MALARSEARRSGDLLRRKPPELGFGNGRVLLKKVEAPELRDDEVWNLRNELGRSAEELGNGGGKVEIEE